MEVRQMGKRGFIDIDPDSPESALYYDDLPKEFVQRAKKLFPVVRKLFPGLSLKDWINGFQYGLYPEREIAKWEDEVNRYLDETGEKGEKKVTPKVNRATWTRVLEKMNKEDYLEYLLEDDRIELEEDEKDNFESETKPKYRVLRSGERGG
jgi:hypothetical protein